MWKLNRRHLASVLATVNIGALFLMAHQGQLLLPKATIQNYVVEENMIENEIPESIELIR